MIRFAVAVTAVEIALTVGAAAWVSLSGTGEPFLARGDFETLGIPVDGYATERRTRFGSLFCFDTRATAREGGVALTVSVRVDTPAEEYASREAAERWPRLAEGDQPPAVADESTAGEPGFVVRQRGRRGVRVEIIRLRGREMLSVRAVRPDVPAGLEPEASAACERLARRLHEYAGRKLGWRE